MLALTLLVFGGIVAGVSWNLRGEIRQQILARDAEVLYPILILQLSQTEREFLSQSLLPDEAQLLDAVLEASELKGVIGVRIFNPKGEISDALPLKFLKGTLSGEDMEQVGHLVPVSHYYPEVRLTEYFLDVPESEEGSPFPVIEALIPLHRDNETTLLGVAQFLIEGSAIQAEFAALDRSLIVQSGIAFLSGSGLIALVIIGAFRRLSRANALLEKRTEQLLSANHELNLAAKTSAIGALTSHLIHGLKNPLSGLQQFVQSQDAGSPVISEEERHSALESTRRMQDMIQEIVTVLQEEKTGEAYELTFREIQELVREKSTEVARRFNVAFSCGNPPEGRLDSRRANLLMLILMNLIQNAIEATPPEREVTLHLACRGDALDWHVKDQGEGLPDPVRKNLFVPCKSHKKDGSGLGLAISHQLARHIGADLSLKSTGPDGSCFRLHLESAASSPEGKTSLS